MLSLFGQRALICCRCHHGPHPWRASCCAACPSPHSAYAVCAYRDYGLQPSDLPESDKRAWNEMIARHPEYVPDRDDSKKVLILRQVGDDKDITIKKMAVKQQAAAKSTLASRQKAIQALENAATTAEADTKVLKLVADSLAQGAPE
jgi:hypothetical protein